MSVLNKMIHQFYRQAFLVLIFQLCIIFWALPASSQILDSNLYNWYIYEAFEEDMEFKKCYIVNYPFKSDTNDTARTRPYLMIARFQKTREEEVSIFGGFDYKLSALINILIDNTQFNFKTKNDYAWAKTKSDDVRVIETLLRSSMVTVRSDSALGTYAVDQYNLKGITKAYKRMREMCR